MSGKIRYLLIILIFFVSAVVYIDRSNISIAGTYLAQDYHISKIQLGWVFSSFLLGYAAFQIPDFLNYILAGGTAGKRFVLPNAKVMIHQGSGGFRGTPADIQIAAREILSQTQRYAEIIALHSGRDVEEVMRDIDRDRFLGPADAVDYGLADRVLAARD